MVDSLENRNICPICGEVTNNSGDLWYEFNRSYHCSCLRKLEQEGKPFHENYSMQKRISAQQVLDVLTLLNDKAFLEYWLFVYCSKEEQAKLYSHPILYSKENVGGLDLFP